VILFVLVAVLTLTIDVGRMFRTKAVLQNAADAASLAAAHVLATQQVAGESETDARAAALGEAIAVAAANCTDPDTAGAGVVVAFGREGDGGEFVTADEETMATAVRVRAFRTDEADGGPLAMLFGRILGLGFCDVTSAATCEVATDIRGVSAGLRPFALWEEDVADLGQLMTFYEHEQVEPGLFGLLNLDGGSCGTPELTDWILNGYSGFFAIDDDGYIWIDGSPGFRASLKDEIGDIVGEPIIVVVYDQVFGTGSNGDFRCIGFLSIIITDYRLTGNNKYIECRVGTFSSVYELVTGGDYSSPNLKKIQLVD
jgi:hypothetical protein